jgi:mRNA interferase MazF
VILADQVKCLDWQERKAQWIARVPDAVIKDVLAKLNTLLG